MNINISIEGVLRNSLDKIIYLYEKELIPLNEENDKFKYSIDQIDTIKDIEVEKTLIFQSKEEYENFLYIDYSLEIFGHSNVSYKNVFNDLNEFIYNNKKHNITLIGLDEMGKSKSSTLFFLSKNGCLCNNIRFIKSTEIEKEWKKCKLWVTANKNIVDLTPNKKESVLFETKFNSFFHHKNKINNIKEIKNYA